MPYPARPGGLLSGGAYVLHSVNMGPWTYNKGNISYLS